MSITFADTKRGLAIICAVCHRSFVARRRTAQFCGTRCRKVAERRRGGSSNPSVTLSRRSPASAVGTRAPKSAERIPARPISPRQRSTPSAADVTLSRSQPVGIVPNERWSNMWHIKYADGRLSDTVNLARARDALHGGGVNSTTRPQGPLEKPVGGSGGIGGSSSNSASS